MKFLPASLTALMLALLMGCVTVLLESATNSKPPIADSTGGATGADSTAGDPTTVGVAHIVAPKEDLAPFIDDAINWLAKAQHDSGGWGAGSHSSQQIRDPHKVQTDPATTAFTAMALLRVGGDPTSGKYKNHLRKAS